MAVAMEKTDIEQLRRLRHRHGRRKSGLILCEGVRACLEAARRRPGWLQALALSRDFPDSAERGELENLAREAGATLLQIEPRRFKEFAGTENPQGVLCVLRRPPNDLSSDPKVAPFVLILDRVSDPGNLGTIARTAWAAGLAELWITDGTTDPYGPKATRSGMGAQFALTIRQFSDLRQAAARLAEHGGVRLWRSSPGGGVDCYSPDFDLRTSGLVVGNESHGAARPRDCALPVEEVAIPMPGRAESLNAAQAATILIFEGVRRGMLVGQGAGGVGRATD